VSFTNSEGIVQQEKKKHPAVDGNVRKSLHNGRKKIIFEAGAVHVSEKGKKTGRQISEREEDKAKVNRAFCHDIKAGANKKFFGDPSTIKDVCAVEVKVQLAQKLHYDEQVHLLESKLKRAEQETYEIKSKLKTEVIKGKTVEEQICHTIEQSCSEVLPGKYCKNKAALVLSALQSEQLMKGEMCAALSTYPKKNIQNMFRPSRLLKACDLGPIGSFLTGTIECLRQVIDESKEGYFSSSTAVSRARIALDNHAFNLVGWTKENTRHGEVFFLNKEKLLRLLLKATNLHELARTESVKISMSIDGADLVRDHTHVSAGIKITDEHGIHPVTKQPLLVVNDDGDEMFVNVQSYHMCSIMIIADA
jgi:hypothetical protein